MNWCRQVRAWAQMRDEPIEHASCQVIGEIVGEEHVPSRVLQLQSLGEERRTSAQTVGRRHRDARRLVDGNERRIFVDHLEPVASGR